MTNSDMENTILSQCTRLNNTLNSLNDIEIENSVDYSRIRLKIQTLHKKVEKQWSIIKNVDVTYITNVLKEALDKTFQEEKVEKLLLERKLMNDELDDIKNNTLKAKNKQKELSQKLKFLEHKQYILEDMMKSTNEKSVC